MFGANNRFRTRKRTRRPRRGWLEWLLDDLLPDRSRGLGERFGPGLAAMLAIFFLTGCEPEVAKVQIKMPRDAVQSTQAVPVIPPFTEKGATMKLRASAFDAKDRYKGPADVRWSSTDPSVVTVSQDGLITILGSGEAQVKVETRGEKKLTGSIEVEAKIPAEVKIIPPEGDEKPTEIHLGDEKKFSAEVIDDKGHVIEDAKIRWEPSNFAITVGGDGTVEGRAIGDVQLVVVEPKSGISASLDMNVLDWDKKKKRKR